MKELIINLKLNLNKFDFPMQTIGMKAAQEYESQRKFNNARIHPLMKRINIRTSPSQNKAHFMGKRILRKIKSNQISPTKNTIPSRSSWKN